MSFVVRKAVNYEHCKFRRNNIDTSSLSYWMNFASYKQQNAVINSKFSTSGSFLILLLPQATHITKVLPHDFTSSKIITCGAHSFSFSYMRSTLPLVFVSLFKRFPLSTHTHLHGGKPKPTSVSCNKNADFSLLSDSAPHCFQFPVSVCKPSTHFPPQQARWFSPKWKTRSEKNSLSSSLLPFSK